VLSSKFPKGINQVFKYYRNEGYVKWFYLDLDVDGFIRDFYADKEVRLGMKHENGRLNVATFKKSQIQQTGTWDDDRKPTDEERQYFRSPRSRSRSTRDVDERHRSRTPGPSSQQAPDFETVRAGFQKVMSKKHSGNGRRPQIVWFNSVEDSALRLETGKSLKVAVKIHHGSLTIYKVDHDSYTELGGPSAKDEDNVLRALGYRE
jgi:hypothetical protein